ncbi:hypothetical protein LTR85_001270 [Meristemomyces frigidus]|nr:hypothetical protein LTR85_001270 [Meristemomyces frigidus]
MAEHAEAGASDQDNCTQPQSTTPVDAASPIGTKDDCGENDDVPLGPAPAIKLSLLMQDASDQKRAPYHFLFRCPKCDTTRVSDSGFISAYTGPEQKKEDLSSDSGGSPITEPDEADGDGSSKADASPEGPFVQYRSVYRDPQDEHILYSTVSYETLKFGSTGDAQQQKAIFDVVAELTAAKHYPYWEREKPLETAPFVKSSPEYTIHIHSPGIIHAIQSVVHYFPGLEFSQETLIIEEPFAPLVHHYEQLTAFRERCRPEVLDEESSDQERSVYGHLGLLLQYLDDEVMPRVIAEKQRHARGVATWSMLWLLFRPGMDVAYLATNHMSRVGVVNRCGGVVHTVSRTESDADEGFAGSWEIAAWNLRYDGMRMGRRARSTSISYFDGELDISRFQIVPIEVVPTMDDGTSFRDYSIEMGKRWFSLTKRQCRQHHGRILDTPYVDIDSLVMIDMEMSFVDNEHTRPDLAAASFELKTTPMSDSHMSCSCAGCAKSSTEPPRFEPEPVSFNAYDNILMETVSALSDHQYLLCPQFVQAYFFKTQEWQMVDVSNLSPPEFNPDMITSLVMSEKRIKLLKGLTQSFMRQDMNQANGSSEAWTADFVKGKGNSQIFLLHGPPGVGKTYTAGFLRAIEFYEGILFLTTNRVGVFDDAFISRIHVKLRYDALTDSDRSRVWNNFIDKLKTERKDKIRVMRDVYEYIESKKVKELVLNGREIRNLFQTAVGLAEFEGEKDEEGKVKLKEDHIAQVVEMAAEFKEYLDDLHQGNEAKRAERKYQRMDETPTKAGR